MNPDLWQTLPFAQDVMRSPDLARRNAEHICECLEGIAFNPSPSLVPIRPTVLPASVRSTFDSAASHLVDLLHRVCWSLTSDPAELARVVGLRPEQVPLLGAAGSQHEIDYSTCNGRLDVLLENGIPLFLEANFGAANVDPIVTHFQLSAYNTLYGLSPRRDERTAGEPFEGRARLYRRILRHLQAPQSVAIVGYADPSSGGTLRYYEAEAHYLRAQGFESDFVPPSFFSSPNRKYSIALKHYLSEYWQDIGLPIDDTASAHASTFFLVPDSGRALSSKLLFAWLSAAAIPLSEADRDFVQKHIPWTRRMEPAEVEFDERSWLLSDLAIDRRDEFVLKPISSCGGKGVLLGRITTPTVWQRSVNGALEKRDHILQRYIEADPLTMDFFSRNSGKVRTIPVTYVLGAYLVDGMNAGSTIRHFPHGEPGVVNLDRGASFNVVL